MSWICYLCSIKRGHMRKYICMGIVTAVLLFAIGHLYDKNRATEKKWKDAVENVKSYSEQFCGSEKKGRAFKLTIDQLEHSRDSIFQELDRARKELRIKDTRLQGLQYVASSFSRADTITLRDTLFRDQRLMADTVLSDEWYSIRIGLEYPSTIAVQPVFRSVKHIIVSARKETVNPPKKFFLWRWLQKRHTVLNIDVVEKNPWVKDESNRYVKIIR